MRHTQESTEIKVWDPLIRLFHWTLVISFTLDYLTGEALLGLHVQIGYLIAGLLLFRVVWGFIGSRHARFSDFLYPPGEIIAYLKSLGSGHPRRYLGHNPAGGLMVLALLTSLGLTTISGLMMIETPEPVAATLIPSAHADDDDDDRREHRYAEDDDDEENEAGFNEAYEEIHEFFANLTLLLVLLHIAGVVVSSRLHHEPLVRAMITGKKPADPPA